MRWLAVVTLLGCSSKFLGGAQSNTGINAETHSAFPVAHEGAHAGVDCNMCHGDFETFAKFSCTSGCHPQAQCDGEHGGLPNYSWASDACLSCHPTGSALGSLASHPFPIDPASTHANIACKTCHIVPGDYGKFSCTNGCHAQTETDGNHAGVMDYAYDSPRCLQCHPKGIADIAVSHTRFPIGDGTKHAAIGCSQCHVDRTKTSDASQYKCATCHAAADAALISKHTTTTSNTRIHVKASEISTTDSRTCLRCHPAARVDLTRDHPTRRPCTSEGSPPHHNAGCTECHSGYKSDPAYAAEFSGAKPPGCAQCHENGTLCNN